MKKIYPALIAALLALGLFFLAGCGAGADADDGPRVDLDLSRMGKTMVFSQVLNMTTEPEDYVGMTVKARGLFYTFEEDDGDNYYACVIEDATACCAQGLEFQLAEERVFPDEFPAPDEEITVVGTFDMYTEEYKGREYTYLVLRDARLL